MKQRIGFVGLGLMGGSLARHLLSAGGSAGHALQGRATHGRGEWDTSDIISFYDELANI